MTTNFEDIDKIKAKVEDRIRQEQKEAGDPKGDSGNKIQTNFILDCLEMGPLGDGLLCARANEGEKIYNATIGAWFTWMGHRWGLDIENKALAAVGKVTDLYEKAGVSLSSEISKAIKKGDSEAETKLRKKQKEIYKRIKRLQTERGRKECLHFSHINMY